ncbi:MAG TPA: flagellar basal-body rod protein FlgF [Aquabacterium sp.]|nr:flagellar basal-body rod protein FlgF [Aquabacterium sp.]
MDALIYTAMSGAERTLRAQQVHANNLANLETSGFRADLALSQSQAVAGFGYDARHVVQMQTQSVANRQGTLRETGRELDVAISGEGYFAVRWADGEAYTRSGTFSLDAQGTLNLNGHPVLGDGGPIVLPPFSQMAIAQDGTISIRQEGNPVMQPVDRLKLVTLPANGVTKNEAGFIVSRAGTPATPSDTVQVHSGHLESSNVSAIEEMIATMSLNRDFELQMKLYKAADSMADTGNRLIRE